MSAPAMARGRRPFIAYPVQERLYAAAATPGVRRVGFGGGIRGTKTWGTLSLLVLLCKLFPRSRWAVVRKDLPTLRKNTLPSFSKLRDEHFGDFIGPVNQSTWSASCVNGSELIFFPESFDTDKELDRWKGLEVNGFLFEEADECQEASYHKAVERAGAWIIPGSEANPALQPPPYIFATFNPNASWPRRLWYEPWRDGTIAPPFAFIPATHLDNPSIPAEVRDAWKDLPPEDYKRFVEGDWESLGGRYYKSLKRSVHLVPRDRLPAELPSWWEVWCAFDWGYAHWAVYGVFARSGGGEIYCLDSLWVRQQQDEELADSVATFILDVTREFALSAGQAQRLRSDIYAGHDCWVRPKARSAQGVSTVDVFWERQRLALTRADVDRVNGGRAVRRALQIRGGDDERTAKAGVYLVYYPERPAEHNDNRRVFDQLAQTLPDPNDINKPQKVDADAEGRGGDDGADFFRYGVATRVPAPIEPVGEPVIPVDRDTRTIETLTEVTTLGDADDQLPWGY